MPKQSYSISLTPATYEAIKKIAEESPEGLSVSQVIEAACRQALAKIKKAEAKP